MYVTTSLVRKWKSYCNARYSTVLKSPRHFFPRETKLVVRGPARMSLGPFSGPQRKDGPKEVGGFPLQSLRARDGVDRRPQRRQSRKEHSLHPPFSIGLCLSGCDANAAASGTGSQVARIPSNPSIKSIRAWLVSNQNLPCPNFGKSKLGKKIIINLASQIWES